MLANLGSAESVAWVCFPAVTRWLWLVVDSCEILNTSEERAWPANGRQAIIQTGGG